MAAAVPRRIDWNRQPILSTVASQLYYGGPGMPIWPLGAGCTEPPVGAPEDDRGKGEGALPGFREIVTRPLRHDGVLYSSARSPVLPRHYL